MSKTKHLLPILEVNQKLLDILGIPIDQREFVVKVQVNITPEAYPEVLVTQFIVDVEMESTIEFELRSKDVNSSD